MVLALNKRDLLQSPGGDDADVQTVQRFVREQASEVHSALDDYIIFSVAKYLH